MVSIYALSTNLADMGLLGHMKKTVASGDADRKSSSKRINIKSKKFS